MPLEKPLSPPETHQDSERAVNVRMSHVHILSSGTVSLSAEAPTLNRNALDSDNGVPNMQASTSHTANSANASEPAIPTVIPHTSKTINGPVQNENPAQAARKAAKAPLHLKIALIDWAGHLEQAVCREQACLSQKRGLFKLVNLL